jgi:hypothetical protein
MWRALFLAIGVFLMLLGIQCLGVTKFTMKSREDPPQPTSLFETPGLGPQKQISPAPWAPWSLLATGAVVCLYSFTLPRRVTGN